MKKNITLISIATILIISVVVASYVLLIMPKQEKETLAEKVSKLEQGEKYETATVSTDNWDTENRVNIVYDTANVPVPVPKGYVASGVDGEHTVNTGFVIYEGTEEVNDSNKEEAQKTRNQWVWVPVENPNDIYGTDSQGKKHGKLYEFSSSGKAAKNWTENNGVMNITSSTSYREPDILTSYDYDSYMPYYITEETRNNINKELKENFEMTIESIEKYGGFYIGRYETGGLNGAAKVVRGDTNISNQRWYTMYEKSKELRGNNSNVRTSMIWGFQWDATLEWLVKSGSKTYSEVGSDSSSWGNYRDNTVTGHGSRQATGYSEVWKANNIYDMAGNVWDLTLEAYNTYYRVLRGGGYYRNGGSSPADDRDDDSPSLTDGYYGTRAILYVAL
ncbi:MAG: hypothetical protein J6D03_10795 [Clostridia bacterium]|nr:hypothetical protein [Clostridia bacterium]